MHTLDGKQPSGSFPESAMPGAAGRSFGWLRVYSITLGELGLLHRGSERQGFVASRFKILAAVLHVHLFSNQGSSSLRSRLEMCTRP